MSFGPQRPSATLEDLEEKPKISPDIDPRIEIADTYDTHHLCLRCVHTQVCAIPLAIRTLGAEGGVVISKCAAFFELPKASAGPKDEEEAKA